MFSLSEIRKDFPFLEQSFNKRPVIFFDTGASAQKPKQVIDCISSSYAYNYANIHRGVYPLSIVASDRYDESREKVKRFINADSENSIIFTKGTTESLNLLAYSLVASFLKENDAIVTTEMEHHANFVPWQQLAKINKLKFKVSNVNDDGSLDIQDLLSKIDSNTKILALTLCSNVLGTVNPVKMIIEEAKKINPNILVIVDGAQAIIHDSVDVQDLGCDFFVFSAHKLYGPTGVGVLYGRQSILDKMLPFNYGGDMIDEVSIDDSTFSSLPSKFEAGTPNIVGVIALGEAIDYVESVGMDNVYKHEKELLDYATVRLNDINGMNIIGTCDNKAGVISFSVDGCHASDIGELLSNKGICVRVGKHCAHPLLKRFGLTSTVRVSFGMYNTFEEVDTLIIELTKIIKMLR